MKCPDCTNHLKIRMKQTDAYLIKIWYCRCGYVEQRVIASQDREDELLSAAIHEWFDRTGVVEEEE